MNNLNNIYVLYHSYEQCNSSTMRDMMMYACADMRPYLSIIYIEVLYIIILASFLINKQLKVFSFLYIFFLFLILKDKWVRRCIYKTIFFQDLFNNDEIGYVIRYVKSSIVLQRASIQWFTRYLMKL